MNTPSLVVLAAGLGSRYGGLKQIDAVGQHDETLLDYSTYDALKSGFKKIVYVIRKDFEKEFRERLFDRIARNCDAQYVFQSTQELLTQEQQKRSRERTKPWGTVHALLCAQKAVTGSFAVINADDYYGRTAYTTIGQHFAQSDESAKEHAMVGFVLENTMSRSGSVSRAVCTVKDGFLISLRENTAIRYEGQKILTLLDGKENELTGKEHVSMNFFGFENSAFSYFEKYFTDFLSTHIESEKGECFLPEAASSLIAEGQGKIKFYESKENWFGMTYPEDRQLVKERISSLTKEDYYPYKLWDR